MSFEQPHRDSGEHRQPQKAAGSPPVQSNGAPGVTAGPPPRSAKRSAPIFPEDMVRVTAWVDPVLDNLGHDPRSGYVERYWLCILGPSCLLLLRRLAAELEQQPDGFDLDTVQWATELGLGMKGGRNGPFWRSIERACRFGTAQRNGSLLAVHRRLPPLTARQIERLPAALQLSHKAWADARLATPTRTTMTKWSPRRDGVDEAERSWDDAA